MMRKFLKAILAVGLLLCFNNISICQRVDATEFYDNSKLRRIKNNAKNELVEVINKSKSKKKIKVTITGNLNNIDIKSIFKFVAPNKYSRQKILSGRIVKETIEISKQRSEKSNGQWIKVKKDPAPLREQHSNLFFPKFVSNKDDVYQIIRVAVKSSEIKEINNKKFRVYEYRIFYDDEDVRDIGIVWVDENSKMVNRIETRNVFGANTADGLIVFAYDNSLEIAEPKNYIEKDWIN